MPKGGICGSQKSIYTLTASCSAVGTGTAPGPAVLPGCSRAVSKLAQTIELLVNSMERSNSDRKVQNASLKMIGKSQNASLKMIRMLECNF